MTILIITGMDDVHADVVVQKAERARPGSVIRLNTDNFADNVEFTLRGPPWVGELAIRDSGRSFRTDEITAVWYRKPVPIRAAPATLLQPVHDFVNSEYEALLRSFMGLLSKAFWVSDYWSVRAASQKLPNLALADSLGLRTPRTLVTSHQSNARAFASAAGSDLIAKPFGLTTFKLDPAASTSWDTFATRLEPDLLDRIAPSLSAAPVILQDYVEKKIELRVTIVGRKVFCTSIDSQQHAFAKQDWRAVDAEELAHHPFDLPRPIEEKLLLFNKYHRLEFSTHDLIIDDNDEFVWLECNPNGQWLWIEHLTGQPIASAILDLLQDPESHGLLSWEDEIVQAVT